MSQQSRGHASEVSGYIAFRRNGVNQAVQGRERVVLPGFFASIALDWFKYVGRKVWARGILHTYTKNIEGYRGPSLELNDFSGP